MRELMSVPHSEIKAALDAEKREKQQDYYLCGLPH
jgi:hypothetical protein